MTTASPTPLRRSPLLLIAVCAVVAVAPWMSGGQEPVARVVTTAALLLGTLLLWRQATPRLEFRQPVVLLAIGLTVWAALSLGWSVNRYDSALWLVGWGSAVLVFILARGLAAVGKATWLRSGYLGLAAIFAVYGIYLYLTGDYDRLTASLYWANPAAAYLLPAVIWATDQAARGRRGRWMWPLVVLLGTTFWLTESRGGILVLALGVTVLIWKEHRWWRYWIQIVFILISTFILSSGVTQIRHITHPAQTNVSIGSRFAEAASGESTSGDDRLRYLEAAGRIWLGHPLVGTGAGTYGAVHPRYQGRVISASNDAHNWYVQVWSELGAVGGLLLVGLLIALVPGIRRGLAAVPGEWPWVIGAVAVAVHIGLDIDASYPAILALAAMGLGMIWRPRPSEMVQRTTLAPAALALCLLVAAAAIDQSNLAMQQAAAAQKDGDYDGAAIAYARAQRTIVYDPLAVTAEGIDDYTLAVTGTDPKENLAAALDRARTAERLAPTQAENYQLEGRVLQAEGDLTGATVAFRRALALDPYNEPSYAQDLAVALQAQGRTREALAVTKAMLGQYPAPVITNRSSDGSLVPALVSLRRYQAYLEDRLGDGATSAADTKAAEALARSR